jgi:hypothetical protein
VRDRWLKWRRVTLGLLVLAALGALDFLAPRGNWYAGHPMSAAALTTLVGFAVVGFFLDGWLQDREGRRLEPISTVAYRSLAQFANDAGRSLLAPLSGADLYALGVPDAGPDDAAWSRALLARHGHLPCFDERTGSWQAGRSLLDPVLVDLLRDPEYVRRAFRVTALVRRRLQEATALWAPVMLTSTSYADHLGQLRTLTDALELLQEQWRLSGLISRESLDWSPDARWCSAVRSQFWTTIDAYVEIRDQFAELAKLPSDAIVRRRGAVPLARS